MEDRLTSVISSAYIVGAQNNSGRQGPRDLIITLADKRVKHKNLRNETMGCSSNQDHPVSVFPDLPPELSRDANN